MTKPPEKSKVVRKLRCAVYTRKSSEEGLEQEFNSLHAQREACEAYIASQRSEGWVLVRDQYDDGGISGGTLDRPGLKRLLEDIEDGLVDVVVVYKIDRLSRSLADFAKLVEVFDRNGVTFVSVTQSFNTTTSMGRLTLNKVTRPLLNQRHKTEYYARLVLLRRVDRTKVEGTASGVFSAKPDGFWNYTIDPARGLVRGIVRLFPIPSSEIKFMAFAKPISGLETTPGEL